MDAPGHRAVALRGNAGLLLWQHPEAAVDLIEEPTGYHAWEYGKREPRAAVHYRHQQQAPAHYLTVLAPFRGSEPPDVEAMVEGEYEPGREAVMVSVRLGEERWRLERDLAITD